MTNGYGDYTTTRGAEMAAYDACPPLLRRAISQAVAPWSAEFMLKQWRAGRRKNVAPGTILRVLIKSMVEGDREDTLRDYGPHHPEAQS